MITHGKNIKIFAGNSNPGLAAEVADHIGVEMGKCKVSAFSDGEISVDINESVRGADVFVIQSTSTPVNNNLMELLIMIDALRRASAGRITAVMPYFGYARQDRKVKSRDPITARLVSDLITCAGVNRVLTMDLHAAQIQGFFTIPLDHLRGAPRLADYFIENGFSGDKTVVVSPDIGGVSRARDFANRLSAPMAIIDKRRPKANISEVMNIIGDISGKRAILVDDIVDTAGTLVKGADALIKRGAVEVYACCTHGVLSGDAIENINKSSLKELIITNTVCLPDEKKSDRIKVISIGKLFADAIERIYEDLPVSVLFE